MTKNHEIRQEQNCIKTPLLFDLSQTLDCGQSFRWCETESGPGHSVWQGIALGHVLRIRQEESALFFHCTLEEFNSIWRHYFDLDTDYAAKQQALAAMHPVLQKAIGYAPGIRILKQDSWEAACSFILSQNNNIPRIKGIIDRLCRLLGAKLSDGLYTFPAAEKLARCSLEDLTPLRAGFRAKYLLHAARLFDDGLIDIAGIQKHPADYGRAELQKINGVGPKVAECALLYGFYKTECFPMDVWMNRTLKTLLPGFSPADFGKNAGIAQQYLFHYSRMHPELFKSVA